MPAFEAGCAVLGQKEDKKENCLIIHPEGTNFPRRPKRIIMAYRLSSAMFTLYRTAFAPARGQYRICLQFTHKSGDFGAIL